MNNNNFSYKNVVDKLNSIFKDFNDIIMKDVELNKKIKIRNRETTFIDALLYKFNYSINDKTKEQIAGEINLLNNKNTFINGTSAKDIVRDEINDMSIKNGNPVPIECLEKEKHLIQNKNEENEESEEEHGFTFEERLRIEHLDKKREGLQKKTFKNIKDELYNAKESMEVE